MMQWQCPSLRGDAARALSLPPSRWPLAASDRRRWAGPASPRARPRGRACPASTFARYYLTLPGHSVTHRAQ